MSKDHAEQLLDDIHNLGMGDDTTLLEIAERINNNFNLEQLVQLTINLVEIKKIATKKLKRQLK